MAPPPPSPQDTPPSRSLTKRFLSASGWSAIRMSGNMVFRLGSNLLLTRILLPEAFGLMAFAMVVLMGATLIADIGIRVSVTRDKDGEDPHFLRAAWTVNVIRGAVISAIILVASLILLPLARLFAAPESVLAAPEIVGVTAIISLSPLIQNLGSTNEFLAQRRMDVRRLAVFDLSTRALGIAILLLAVWVYPTIWSLIVVFIINKIIFSALTHVVLPGPRMAFVWDREIADRLWGFGRWIVGSSIFGFLGTYGERIIFSGALDVATFGIYAVSRLWADAAQQVFVFAMKNAGVSALSEVIRSKSRPVERPFRRLQTGVDILIVLGITAYYFGIGPFILAVYNDTFDPAADIAPLLSLVALRLRFSPFGSLLLASGQSRTMMFVTLQQAVGTWVLVWWAMNALSFEAAVVAYAVSSLVGVPYLLIKAREHMPKRNYAIDWAWFAGCVVLAVVAIAAQVTTPGAA